MKFLLYSTAILVFFALPAIATPEDSLVQSHHPLQCDLNYDGGSRELFISVADCGRQSAPIGIGLGSVGAIARLIFPGGD
jgi:hypothetical protein